LTCALAAKDGDPVNPVTTFFSFQSRKEMGMSKTLSERVKILFFSGKQGGLMNEAYLFLHKDEALSFFDPHRPSDGTIRNSDPWVQHGFSERTVYSEPDFIGQITELSEAGYVGATMA
jgi:hypothetical protein